MEEVTVIIPTRNRYHRLHKCLESLRGQTYENVKVMVICDQDLDTYNKLMLNGFDGTLILTDVNVEWVAGIRLGVEKASSEFIFYAADDVRFDERCIEFCMKCFLANFTDGIGLIKTEDYLNPRVATHGLTTKKTIRKYDGFSRDYVHFYADTELTTRTIRDNKFIFCKEAICEHIHWLNKKVPKDKTYKIVERFLDDDRRNYLRRNGAKY